MGAPTASANCTRSLRSRRPSRSSLNVEPASSCSTQEAASQPERSIEHTIRTQSTVRLGEAITPRRWTVQRDDMADLQAVLVHDDALDDELQNRLSVGKARLPEAAAHTLAEGGHVAQHRLRFDLLAA